MQSRIPDREPLLFINKIICRQNDDDLIFYISTYINKQTNVKANLIQQQFDALYRSTVENKLLINAKSNYMITKKNSLMQREISK